MNGRRKISVVCTCRIVDNDKPWRVGYILEVMDRAPKGAGCEQMRDHRGVVTGYRLRCGRCPRAPEITLARWARLVVGLDEADAHRLDIAALR